MPPNVQDAVAAIDAAIAVLQAAKAKAEDTISDDLFEGGDPDEEIAEVAHLDAEIQTQENRKVHLQAAGVVVSAPSVEEIAVSLSDELREKSLLFKVLVRLARLTSPIQ